ncbi:MAG TPA: hypothetical protein VFU75_06640 [Gemmatimonadales bacterium]|nr:hypothetical protein [Gemmatimonadales bacterium]
MSDDRARRTLLRHALATLAYRGAKAFRDAPEGFVDFRAAPGSRSAGEILAHIGDLLDWGLGLAKGQHKWKQSPVLPWTEGVARFHTSLERFDTALGSDDGLGFSAEQLFQGPIADSFTHVGQIAMLRRLASAPIKGEDYSRADIAAGRVSQAQHVPKVEF